jgi:hypothetical protein
MKGITQIGAPEKNNEILNTIPKTNTNKTQHVTFDEATAPP